MRFLKQSTSVDLPIGPFLDATDGVSAETTLTLTQPDVRLKKNAAGWAQKAAAQTLTHEENGNYEVTLDATDTDTLGLLRLHVAESGAVPVWEDFMVMPANVWDSLFGADRLSVDVGELSGDGTAADNLEAFFDATGYSASASSIGAVTGNVGGIDGVIQDLDALASHGDTVWAALAALHSGTAQAGGASSITLANTASGSDDHYNGAVVVITGGTGAGQDARIITDYVGATFVATVTPAWTTEPDATSVVQVLPFGGYLLMTYLNATVSSRATQTSVDTIDDLLDSELPALTTAVADLPTTAEFEARSLVAADYTVVGDLSGITAVLGDNSIDADTLAADLDTYQAKLFLWDDDANATDRYTVAWHKNGHPYRTSGGITSPTIQVVAIANGVDLIAATAMTEIGTTELYRYSATTSERLTDGVGYVAIVTATIDGASRESVHPVGRDSEA